VTEKKTISKRTVDAFATPMSGETRLWDDRLAGFCLRAYAPSSRAKAGRKVYAVKFRVNGRQSWFTIGEHGQPFTDAQGVKRDSLTAELARDEASLVLADARRGIDPLSRRNERRSSITVGELIDDYLRDGPNTKLTKRASSWATDRSNYDRHVRPLIGKRRLEEVGRDQISELMQGVIAGKTATVEKTKARGKAVVKGGEGVAHRVLSATRAMFNWAIDQGYMRGPNPCVGVKLAKRPNAERFLSAEEAAALFKIMGELEAKGELRPGHAAIFRLLLLTGARRNEIAALRWKDVDLARGAIVLPPVQTKTGATTGERRIALNKLALEILRAQPRPKGAVYVFPASKGESGHTTTAGKVWRTKVRKAAELAGVRIHDLRHSFASFALADGASLALIGKALGHRSSRTTERYSHVAIDPLREIAERVAGRAFGAKPE
jgi:integrase